MELGLTGRKAIICASSKGLGKACAIALAQEGCDIVINGRNQDSLNKTAAEIMASHQVNVIAVAGDISTIEGQKSLLNICPEPDILINNNGGPPFRHFKDLDRTSIISGVIENMVTPIELIQSVIDGMVKRKFGRIVNITSTSVYAPIDGLDLSSGARAGLTSFLAGIARSVASHNVTINQLLPGPFETDRILNNLNSVAQIKNVPTEKLLDDLKRSNPAGRLGNPEEFGHACAFLCSQKSGFITGQNIIIDGGAYKSAF